MTGIALSNILTILAVLLAPFLAVFAQRQIEVWREARNRKVWIFKTLMATRGRTLAPDHVQALNMISLEFIGKSGADVRAAWKEYHDHLNSFPHGSTEEAVRLAWDQKREKFLTDLLHVMGKSLKYKFDSLELRKGAYSPEGHITSDMESAVLRKLFIQWFNGELSVSVSVNEPES